MFEACCLISSQPSGTCPQAGGRMAAYPDAVPTHKTLPSVLLQHFHNVEQKEPKWRPQEVGWGWLGGHLLVLLPGPSWEDQSRVIGLLESTREFQTKKKTQTWVSAANAATLIPLYSVLYQKPSFLALFCSPHKLSSFLVSLPGKFDIGVE